MITIKKLYRGRMVYLLIRRDEGFNDVIVKYQDKKGHRIAKECLDRMYQAEKRRWM